VLVAGVDLRRLLEVLDRLLELPAVVQEDAVVQEVLEALGAV